MWSLTTDKTALSAHLVLARGDTEQEAVLQRATRALRSPHIYTRISKYRILNRECFRSEYQLYEMTLQVEHFKPDMETCGQCHDGGREGPAQA